MKPETLSTTDLLMLIKEKPFHNKIQKLFESHGLYDDYCDFFLEFIKDENIFISKMPCDWKSDRAISTGFEALVNLLELDFVNKYLKNLIGDQVNDLSNRFIELKKNYNSRAKKCIATTSNISTEHIETEKCKDEKCKDDECIRCSNYMELLSFLESFSDQEPDPVRSFLMKQVLKQYRSPRLDKET